MRAPRLRLVVCGALLALLACGGGAVLPERRPTTPLPLPDDREARSAAIDTFGRRAWQALAAGEPTRMLVDELVLRTLLDRTGASRLSALRPAIERRIGDRTDAIPLLANASYSGICLQGAREEPRGGVLGLRATAWVFDRALVIGTRADGRRIAAWLEGTFVFTDAGFEALDLERVEQPRWEHSDLELAPCDLAIRNDLPERAR